LRGFELQDADGYVLFFGRPSFMSANSKLGFDLAEFLSELTGGAAADRTGLRGVFELYLTTS